MRSAAKEKRRGRPAAMTTFRSPSAHVSYWRRLAIPVLSLGHLNFDAERLLLGEQRTLMRHAPDLPSPERAGDDQFASLNRPFRRSPVMSGRCLGRYFL